MFWSLLSDTIDLTQSAQDDLVVISPFLGEGAYNKLRPALRTAAGNGATITLMTRYLTYGDEHADVEFNREFADALAFDDELSEVAFYEYVDNVPRENRNRRPQPSIPRNSESNAQGLGRQPRTWRDFPRRDS